MTHTVFIDLDSHVATASATGTAAPDVPLKHLTKQTLAFAFHSGGTVAAVTGWTEGRVVIKATPTSDVLLLDTTLAATGSTTSTRYSAEWAAVDCDSAALRTLIGASVEPLDVFAEIQWTADSGTHAVSFPIQIVPAFNLPEDDPPDPTEAASWTWLKARLAAGSNITFTDNDTTQVRTIASSGGGGGGGGVNDGDYGDITVSSSGSVWTIDNNAVTNAKVATGIDAAKLANGTVSNAELQYLNGVTSALQTQLDGKQPLASALTTLSSATAAGLALMDDANNAAQRTTLGLGNASTLNVGTSAGTVAAGDDARLSDARTPTAHAASHVTGGSDAIQSATASQNGLATAAQITKLDGIEALADVTDAGNVGSSIHGATAKTTPVDADTVPLIDSAASNVLKKLSWANIKATLKTYFDALYVTGPASATDNAIARFDGTTGKLVQNSAATITDTGTLTVSAAGAQIAAQGGGGDVLLDASAGVSALIWRFDPGDGIKQIRLAVNESTSEDFTLKLPPAAGTAGQVLTIGSVSAPNALLEWSTPAGGGDALTTSPLSQFAATTSDQLRGVISDETGTGALVFANSPTLVTPALGTPASGTLTNCTGLPVAGIAASTISALGVGSMELGHATDTTLARSSAGNVTIEGNLIYRAGGSFVGLPVELQLACSDEGTALTTGTAKLTFRMPHAMTLTAVRASVGTAPTGSTLVVDINEGGTSILGTKLSIDATEKTSTTAASAATITDSALADDAEITIDIDQIGSTIAGAGLKVTLIGTRA